MIAVVITILFLGLSVVSSSEKIIDDETSYHIYQEPALDMDELFSDGQIAYYITIYNELWEWEIGGESILICQNIDNYYSGTWSYNETIIALKSDSTYLYEINPNSCDEIYFGDSTPFELEDIVYDSYNETLWGITGENFYSLNMTNGEATYIGSFEITSGMEKIEDDGDGNLYGMDSDFSSFYLYSIDTITGKATKIGPTGISGWPIELAYDIVDEIMYLIAFNYGSFRVEWYTVDLTNGDATFLGTSAIDIVVFLYADIYSFKQRPIADFNWRPPNPAPEEIVTFDASESYDPDGNITLYEWDWENDGIFDESHNIPTATHIWSNVGHYQITLRVTDNDYLTRMKTKTIIIGNEPPNPPTINGPTGGKPDVEYTYTFVSIDPNEQDVKYYIDWGDGDKGWTQDYYPSGEEIIFSHTWNKGGRYTIISQAMDLLGYKSPFSTLKVRMPRDRAMISSMLLRFLGQFPFLRLILNNFLILN